MANSQIKVLRHENKSLRDAAESTMQNDQHDVEESLVEINNQLQSATISALEVQYTDQTQLLEYQGSHTFSRKIRSLAGRRVVSLATPILGFRACLLFL